ncbi:HepT-like ribonuclease domain-containing protein [Salinibacter ruber]|uniref:HepT-like ribonuclease domain-containing protein n=1 Tax=Salinibacter ruber TaxID=146919 RepID=UPI0019551E57
MSADETDAPSRKHIQERIGRIEVCAQKGREAFDASPILQDAVMCNFGVIGEAVKQLFPDLRDRYSSVEWRRVADVRDVLIHNYMGG